MANKTDTNGPATIDNASGKVLPTRAKKIDLATINDVRLEMASVYRGMKSGKIETSDGTKLVYVLGQIGKMIEVHEIEKRIELLEAGDAGETRKLEPLNDEDFLG